MGAVVKTQELFSASVLLYHLSGFLISHCDSYFAAHADNALNGEFSFRVGAVIIDSANGVIGERVSSGRQNGCFEVVD